MEYAEQNSVIDSCKTEEHDACLFTLLKYVPYIIGKEGDLVTIDFMLQKPYCSFGSFRSITGLKHA